MSNWNRHINFVSEYSAIFTVHYFHIIFVNAVKLIKAYISNYIYRCPRTKTNRGPFRILTNIGAWISNYTSGSCGFKTDSCPNLNAGLANHCQRKTPLPIKRHGIDHVRYVYMAPVHVKYHHFSARRFLMPSLLTCKNTLNIIFSSKVIRKRQC